MQELQESEEVAMPPRFSPLVTQESSRTRLSNAFPENLVVDELWVNVACCTTSQVAPAPIKSSDSRAPELIVGVAVET